MNIYTDGATSNNQTKKLRRGGIGVYFGHEDERNISMEIKENPTNQRMELTACIKALEISNNSDINIYTDSKYVIDSITKWSINWKKHEWQKYNIRKKKYVPIKIDDKRKEYFVNTFNERIKITNGKIIFN